MESKRFHRIFCKIYQIYIFNPITSSFYNHNTLLEGVCVIFYINEGLTVMISYSSENSFPIRVNERTVHSG